MPLAFLKLLHIIKNKLECGNYYGNKASRDAVLGGQRLKTHWINYLNELRGYTYLDKANSWRNIHSTNF